MTRGLLTIGAAMFLTAPAAWAEPPAQVNFGCAPWDGRTLEIAVMMPPPPDATNTPPTFLYATLWGKGLTAVQQGERNIVLASDGAMDGNGRARVCVGKNCAARAVMVQFDKAELHEGGLVAGTMKFDIPDNYQTFSFQGKLQGSALCG